VTYVSRGNSSKGGTGKVFSNKGKTGPGVRTIPANLSRRVAQKMIGMRLSGKSQSECDEWLEEVIQAIEAGEIE
jgi:hypothetical protein